jgi:hypothetical protein
MSQKARTPVFPETAPLGALSAQIATSTRAICDVRSTSTTAVHYAFDYRGVGWIGLDLDPLIEIPRMANAIGNAAAQSSAMNQNARGPKSAVEWTGHQCNDGGHRADGDAALDPLSRRSQGRRNNHRQHLHAGKM